MIVRGLSEASGRDPILHGRGVWSLDDDYQIPFAALLWCLLQKE